VVVIFADEVLTCYGNDELITVRITLLLMILCYRAKGGIYQAYCVKLSTQLA